MKRFILPLVVSSWASLGVYRGVQQYNYLEERNNNSTYLFCHLIKKFNVLADVILDKP